MHIIAFNRHWVVDWRWLFISLLAISLLMGLSYWQWQRALGKAQLIQRLSQSQQLGAASAEQLRQLTPGSADGLQLRELAHWLSPRVWLLDNRLFHGQIGYDVIVPMQLHTTKDILLIDLGWIAAPRDRAQLPSVEVPAEFMIQGVLRTQLGGIRLGKNIEDQGIWPMRIQQIDIAELSATLPREAYPGLVYQLRESPYKIHYQAVVMGPDRHRAYALQWALLALAVAIIGLAASCKKLASAEQGVSNAKQ